MVTHVPLLRSEDLTVGEAHCSASTPEWGDEEVEPAFALVFPMAGLYVRHIGGEDVVGNPAVALFLNKHEVQRTSHPNGSGDHSVVFSLSRRFAEPFLERETGEFPVRAVRTSARVDLQMRVLARDGARGTLTVMEAEERVLSVLRHLLRDSARNNLPQSWHHRALVRDAEEFLTSHFVADSDLRTVARNVGSSPHHLSRVFHSVTGSTLSDFRTQLRIRAVVAQLGAGALDLSRVAVEAGFYDHAHMTNTIRKHLRSTPTAIRSILVSGTESAHAAPNDQPTAALAGQLAHVDMSVQSSGA